MSALSTFILVTVAESKVACEPVSCATARLVKDALSPMSIASIFKVPTARVPIVAESRKHYLHL